MVRSPLIGQPAPVFSLPALAGGQVASREYVGRVYVVNFWASWCVPCRAGAPNLEAFSRRWASQGVGVVGVVFIDSAEQAAAFRDEFGLTYPQVLDPGGLAALDYGVFGIPETFGWTSGAWSWPSSPAQWAPTPWIRPWPGCSKADRNHQYRTGPADAG